MLSITFIELGKQLTCACGARGGLHLLAVRWLGNEDACERQDNSATRTSGSNWKVRTRAQKPATAVGTTRIASARAPARTPPSTSPASRYACQCQVRELTTPTARGAPRPCNSSCATAWNPSSSLVCSGTPARSSPLGLLGIQLQTNAAGVWRQLCRPKHAPRRLLFIARNHHAAVYEEQRVDRRIR